jgi:hypothetical protein
MTRAIPTLSERTIIAAFRKAEAKARELHLIGDDDDVETIRKPLCRDGSGNASGPLGVALDLCYVA